MAAEPMNEGPSRATKEKSALLRAAEVVVKIAEALEGHDEETKLRILRSAAAFYGIEM